MEAALEKLGVAVRIPYLLDVGGLAPAYRWRMVKSLFAQWQSLVEGSLALFMVQAICAARSGWAGFWGLAALTLVVLALRYQSRLRFEAAQVAREPGDRPEKWVRVFAAGAMTTAVLWGLTDLVVLIRFNDPVLQMFLLMVQAGWLGGAAVRNASSPAVVLAQALLTLAPCVLGLLLAQSDFIRWMVPFVLLQVSATLSVARYLGRQMTQLMESEERLGQANMQLAELSATDALTGIGNRRAFDAALLAEWARAARDASDLGLLVIDVDHFKLYNDRYGHPAGDDCLRLIAEITGAALRRPPDFAARYGGEEFVALLPGTDEAGAREVAERLRLAIVDAGLLHEASGFGRVTVSIGAASMAPAPRTDAQSLVRLADEALYDAKQGGRNQVRTAGDRLDLGVWRGGLDSGATVAPRIGLQEELFDDKLPARPGGLRTLVVEDERMVAMLLEEMLAEAGCSVMGPADSVDAALALLAEETPVIGLLDVTLGNGPDGYGVAEALAARGVPFAFVTGEGASRLRADFRDRPVLQKPFHMGSLMLMVHQLARLAAA
jgi:diguanylate cyclase (GGDEF)-like protein